MKVLVIIVTYNGMQWVERCLGSVRSSLVKADAFVVDNGSTDGTQEYIQQHFPETIFHQSKENLGFGKANNLGLQYALDNEYEYVYLLNQDAWIFPDTIKRLVELYENNSGYGILSPFQMNSDVKHIDVNFLARLMCSLSFKDFLVDLYNNNLRDVYEVEGVMAAHWFVPIAVIEKVGLFSPSFLHYGEDDNYIDRLLYKGFKVGVTPCLRVVHDRGRRVETPEKKMYIDYVQGIRLISNPSMPVVKTLWFVFKTTVKNVLIYKSLKPIEYTYLFMSKFHYFMSNKAISLKIDCAFCKHSNN